MKHRWCLIALGLAAASLLQLGCGGGPRVALDPESRAFYETARLIMDRDESRIFDLLADKESRREFIEDFWAKRDPNPDTETNEFREEFQKRIAYAAKRFKGEGRRGWDTDRGRIYVYMGPPDKFEEDFTTGDPGVRGSIIWWIYYRYGLGIEFVDEKGNGSYRIRNYQGDFFEAMDVFKLGASVGTADAFLKKAVRFNLVYDRASGEAEISLPAKALNFKEDEDGRFSIDLRFKFYIYSGPGLAKTVKEEVGRFSATNRELDATKDVRFRFALPLRPGVNYVDVLIKGQTGSGRIRRLFEVKVSP